MSFREHNARVAISGDARDGQITMHAVVSHLHDQNGKERIFFGWVGAADAAKAWLTDPMNIKLNSVARLFTTWFQ